MNKMVTNWYIVHTYAGQEERVKERIERVVRLKELEHKVKEVFIPMEDVMEVKRGQKKIISRTFFPGYILVNMEKDIKLWDAIQKTRGVTGFISSGREPIALSEEEVKRIKGVVEERKEKPQPKVVIEEGESVKITEGPFANFTGYVEEVVPERGRIRVMVSVFGRSTPVDLEYSQVEKD